MDNRGKAWGVGEDSEGEQYSQQNLVIKYQLCRDLRAQYDKGGKMQRWWQEQSRPL